MKIKLLIIIGIVIVSAMSLSYYTIYDSPRTVFLSCDPKYEQIDDKCILLKPEQYCKDWCNVEDLSTLGCNKLALDYIFKATNIIDGKPGESYYWNWIGMPDGLSEEEFEMCSDILKEKRTKYENNSDISIDRIVYPDPRFCADEYDKMYLKASAIPCSCCNPSPGEPVCEPVPIEDHIRDMIIEEFKPCISTIDRWAYLADHNDSVWYAFGTNYVKLKMEKTNLEKSIPISITFSGYSQCLNDFHLIVKEHIGDRKIMFKEKYDQVCDYSKPNNEFKTYREISLNGVGKPIILAKGQYLIELYTDTPQIHGSNYVDKVYFSSYYQ